MVCRECIKNKKEVLINFKLCGNWCNEKWRESVGQKTEVAKCTRGKGQDLSCSGWGIKFK